MNQNNNDRAEVHSISVRAGKRTYFFDVRATKDENLYLTITESKKKSKSDGSYFYEKHKIFLYKEDLIKFTEGLNEAIGYIRENNPTLVEENVNLNGNYKDNESSTAYSNLDFDELG